MKKKTFGIKIQVVVIASISSSFGKILMVKDNNNDLSLPGSYLLNKKDINYIAADILYEYAGITDNWAPLIPLGFFLDDKNKNDLLFVYSVFIPDTTRIRVQDSCWVDYNNDLELNEINKSIIEKAIWRKI